MEKNDEKRKKMKKLGFTRKILDDFQGFVSECVSLPMKINNPFCGVTFGLRKSHNFHWT